MPPAGPAPAYRAPGNVPPPTSAGPAPAVPPRGSPVSAGPVPAAAVPRTGASPAAAPTGRPAKKVAHFITTEAAQSTIKPAADGKLPELRLHEGREAEVSKEKGGGLNPLLLLGAICLSVGLCVVLLLVDVDSQDSANVAQKQRAREVLDKEWYLANEDPSKPLMRYQTLLRQSQQAHSRGDRGTEHRLYRKVLDMLRAERGKTEKGLTGSPARDKTLEDQISILLSD
jgi:hypothetical protein